MTLKNHYSVWLDITETSCQLYDFVNYNAYCISNGNLVALYLITNFRKKKCGTWKLMKIQENEQSSLMMKLLTFFSSDQMHLQNMTRNRYEAWIFAGRFWMNLVLLAFGIHSSRNDVKSLRWAIFQFPSWNYHSI